MPFPTFKRGDLPASITGLHWVVILLSLALTLVAWQVSARMAEEKAREEFEHQIGQLNELIVDRMRNYAFAMVSGVGAIHAKEGDMSLEAWRSFSQSLALTDRLPGINGIGIIQRVSPDDVDAFVEAQRAKRPDFRIHPAHSRNDYWPIVFIEPEAANKAAVGLDMAHESNRYQAARRAMITGKTQITGPIVLVQDAQKTPGFLFFQPFYDSETTPPPGQRDAHFEGLVYAPFIMSRLMEGALANVARMIQVRITDNGSVMYDEFGDGGENVDATPMFAKTYSLDLYGRHWDFDVQTNALFERFHSSKQPTIILAAGIVIEVLIILVILLLKNARVRAEAEVKRKTRELRESLDFIETLTDQLPLAIGVWDSGLKCQFMNGYGKNMLRFSQEKTIGRPISDFIGEDVVAERRNFYQRALQGETISSNARFTDRAGEPREVSLKYFPIVMKEKPCFVSIALDVTELKAREKELEQLNAELEVQTRQAEAAASAKAAFLANMSHEIRTPMNAILGMLVLMLDTNIEEYPRSLARKALSASEGLLSLLNDILDISKIESGHVDVDCREFEVQELLQRSVELFAIAAEEKGLDLVVDVAPAIPGSMKGDLLRISQVLINVIGNAVKFTEAGRVAVRLSRTSRTDDTECLVVAVQDTGIGIRESDQAYIFETFRQAERSKRRSLGGTGLGLAISKRLCELMGGRLSVTSRVGAGSTFTVEIPVVFGDEARVIGDECQGRRDGDVSTGSGASALASAEGDGAVPQYPTVRVLVVDDLSINCEIVESYLQRFGVSATSVNTGDEALAYLQEQPCDLVFMDLHLERETGQDVARRIRRAPLARQPYVVALSASVLDQDRESAKDSGMEAYLTKPALPADIQRMLARFFSSAKVTGAAVSSALEDRETANGLPDCISAERHAAMFGQIPELFAQCLHSYAASARDIVQRLTESLAAGDAQSIRRLAHRLKGASGNIAHVRLQRMAGHAEGTHDDALIVDEGRALVTALNDDLADIEAYLHSLEDPQRPPASTDIGECREALARVEQRLGGNRLVDEADVDSILGFLRYTNREALAERFKTALERFDFEVARQTLQEVRREMECHEHECR
ncbi:CHASE domain-containing protein [Modicisalibacter coralii]|uniref:CHASE domain-containing protein n=1 Tax=Modicisalibacter coralii TaxID=2304602 RepID=UPI00100A5270|nr:CHASE domain-containing protein [Halomonas coralii]